MNENNNLNVYDIVLWRKPTNKSISSHPECDAMFRDVIRQIHPDIWTI